jgi:hypothetical protein
MKEVTDQVDKESKERHEVKNEVQVSDRIKENAVSTASQEIKNKKEENQIKVSEEIQETAATTTSEEIQDASATRWGRPRSRSEGSNIPTAVLTARMPRCWSTSRMVQNIIKNGLCLYFKGGALPGKYYEPNNKFFFTNEHFGVA